MVACIALTRTRGSGRVWFARGSIWYHAASESQSRAFSKICFPFNFSKTYFCDFFLGEEGITWFDFHFFVLIYFIGVQAYHATSLHYRPSGLTVPSRKAAAAAAATTSFPELVAVVQGEVFVLDLDSHNPEWRQPEIDTSGLHQRSAAAGPQGGRRRAMMDRRGRLAALHAPAVTTVDHTLYVWRLYFFFYFCICFFFFFFFFFYRVSVCVCRGGGGISLILLINYMYT
jgi:hypothetical protein